MKLYIDTSNAQKTIIGLDGELFESESRTKRSQLLLPFILENLRQKDKRLEDITDIEVNVGPGSYTGLRVGLSIAHTLSWSLKIPVNGKYVSNGEFLELQY